MGRVCMRTIRAQGTQANLSDRILCNLPTQSPTEIHLAPYPAGSLSPLR
jgi:hypothetical protein